MSSNVPNARRQVPIDVGADIHEGIKDVILQDFQSGAISDIEMSPSKYIRDILSQYIRYRRHCADISVKPMTMGEMIDANIEVDNLINS